MKVKINPEQLFASPGNIRKRLTISMTQENADFLAEKYDLDAWDIHHILRWATIYLDGTDLPEYIEVEVTEDDQL